MSALDLEKKVQESWLLEALSAMDGGVAIYDVDGYLIYSNEIFRKFNGYDEADTIPGVATYDSLGMLDQKHSVIARKPLTFFDRVERLRQEGASTVIQHHAGRIYERRQTMSPSGKVISLITDITVLHRLEIIQKGRNNVLELLAKGSSLHEVLTALVEHCETLIPNMLGSVLVLDESGSRLLLGAAPSLPETYNDAIHGIEIGMGVGSCGTAAYNGSRVIVEDIATNPLWTDFVDLAAQAGLKACWSQPILSTSNKILGTFAMYYKEVSQPSKEDLDFISSTAHLAGIAIEQHKTEAERKAALHKAEQANMAKSEFLATMSHELRTPLNAIVGFSEMLKSDLGDFMTKERSKEYATDIYNSGKHLLELITDVLDLSAIEAGKRSSHKEMLVLDEILQECVRFVSQQAADGRIDLLCDVPHTLPGLYAEKRSVVQIILNLISNALKFTSPGGSIVVVAKAIEDALYIAVRDTGAGIPAHRMHNITEPFSQGHDDPFRTQKGTGLGLSIVKSLVVANGGALTIESEVGVGTTVSMLFPLKEAPATRSS